MKQALKAALCSTMLLAACENPLDPLSGATLLSPTPQQYLVWGQELEQCSGLQGRLNEIHFYLTDRISGASDLFGYASWQAGWILLEKGFDDEEWAVKHEMMHILLRTADHPLEYFNGICGELRWRSRTSP